MAAFKWRVALSGYSWARLAGGYGPAEDISNEEAALNADPARVFLVPAGDWHYREYEPLTEFTGLFRTFAETPPTAEGILEFANRYGHFGIAMEEHNRLDLTEFIDEVRESNETKAKIDCSNDYFLELQFEIGLMRHCVDGWESIKTGQADDRLILDVQRLVNKHLRGRVKVAFVRNSMTGAMNLQFVPLNLIGALWYQFAQSTEGNKEHRQCGACHRWFEISRRAARTSRYYCTDACRSRAYRLRKDQVWKLDAAKQTAPEIAKELGLDLETIKKWLEEKKGEDHGSQTTSSK